jgi:hypothetical protein
MDPIPITLASGNEKFQYNNKNCDFALIDFWRWALSDIITNTNRGMLAEFTVAIALSLNVKKPRDAWQKYDLNYRDHGIEIKSAAYHQRWKMKKMSTIQFVIRKTRGWDAVTGEMEKSVKRQASIYILCLLNEQKREKVNTLILDQWKFWVIDANFFNQRKRSQHSITLKSLKKEIGEPIEFIEIKTKVDSIIDKKNSLLGKIQ